MERNPYDRPQLAVDNKALAAPTTIVRGWLNRMRGLLKSVDLIMERPETGELVILELKVRRTCPERLGLPHAERVQERALTLIDGHNRIRALRAVLKTIHPQAWRREAMRLHRSYDTHMDPTEQSGWARRLFDQLDDAELAIYEAYRIGEPPDMIRADPPYNTSICELDREWKECWLWLLGHSDTFLAARDHVLSVARTFRPDLAEHDPELARTARKLVLVLDACMQARAEMTHAPKPFPAQVSEEIHRWAERRRSERSQQAKGRTDGPVRLPTEHDQPQRVWHAQAAGITTDTLLARLAAVSPTESPTTDPSRAWAHFLAATYLDTGVQEEWRRACLTLPLPSDALWQERRQHAEALARQRDWQKDCRGAGAYRLEPTGPRNEAEFRTLLERLM